MSDFRPIEILLVEDDAGDVIMTRSALEDGKVVNNLTVVADGVEALLFLRREGIHVSAPRPDLILLDLELPRVDGRRVLAELDADPELRSVPVVVLTTSTSDESLLHNAGLSPDAFMAKPVDFDRLIQVIQQLDQLYVSIVCPVTS